MPSEAERTDAAASAGQDPGRFLEELLVGPGGDGADLVFFPTIIGVVGPGGGGGEEAVGASPGGRIVLISPLGMLVLTVEGGGSRDLETILRDILSSGGGSAGPPPASEASIEAMRTVERAVAGEDLEECAVCLDGLWAEAEEKGAPSAVKEMPCRHRFHGGCIERWLGLHGSCPICRYRMPEEEQGGGKKGSGEEEGEGLGGDQAAGRRMTLESDGELRQHQQDDRRGQEQQEQTMEEID